MTLSKQELVRRAQEILGPKRFNACAYELNAIWYFTLQGSKYVYVDTQNDSANCHHGLLTESEGLTSFIFKDGPDLKSKKRTREVEL